MAEADFAQASAAACGERLFGALLPPGVLFAVSDLELADATLIERLHPQEREQIAQAVASRRREYAAGRALARALLRQMGLDDAPLLNGVDRAPQWPAGVVGSIAHCHSLCVVAVAPEALINSLGLDVEPAFALPEGAASRVLSTREHVRISRLPEEVRAYADRAVFCAKEATYKALYPRLHTFLEFHDLDVELDVDRGFVVTPVRALPIVAAPLRGRYGVMDGYLGAALVVPA